MFYMRGRCCRTKIKMKMLCKYFSNGRLQFTGFSLDITIHLKNGGGIELRNVLHEGEML
jgi:hypothetical protein